MSVLLIAYLSRSAQVTIGITTSHTQAMTGPTGPICIQEAAVAVFTEGEEVMEAGDIVGAEEVIAAVAITEEATECMASARRRR